MVSIPPGTIRNYNIQMQNESPFMFTILNVTNTITNIFLGAVAMGAFVYANVATTPKYLVTSQHIYLCVFGYIILMPQAILSINIHTGWARAFSCNNKRSVHYILQIIASIIGLAGCLRMILQVHHPRGYFSDYHSITGLIAMLLTTVSLVGGVVNLNSSKFNVHQNLVKIMHSTLGCLTLIFAFLAMIFSFRENKAYLKHFGPTNNTLFTVLIIISLILLLISPIMNARRMLA